MTARPLARVVKRGLDVAVSLTLLVLFLPVLATGAAVVRIHLGRPVIFRQRRPGLNGRCFTLLKLRTMRDDRDPDGRPRTDAERLTPVGRWLRASSVDELPQLWNVARGDMSLVGPRPLLADYMPLYTPAQARRHEVRPGVTGLAQVSGRNGVPWDERLRLDVEYVDRWSLALDLRILVRTAGRVLARDGINQAGQATMEPFRGSRT